MGRSGEAIKHARRCAGRSQADVAAALGYHQSKLSREESAAVAFGDAGIA